MAAAVITPSETAEALLLEHGFDRPPVPIRAIADRLGLTWGPGSSRWAVALQVARRLLPSGTEDDLLCPLALLGPELERRGYAPEILSEVFGVPGGTIYRQATRLRSL